MEINIAVGIKINNEEKYDMSLNIPAADLTTQEPFKFIVTSETSDGSKTVKDKVLQVVFCDSSHVYVGVKPPESLLETAGINNYIDQLQVAVKEGNYDESTGTFINS